MIAQALKVGIDLRSPVTWFVVGIACVVLALTLSTRRSTARPRGSGGSVPRLRPRAPAVGSETLARRWSAAQAAFVDDPREGVAQAERIIAELLSEPGARDPGGAIGRRYHAARAIAARPDASTEELRTALLDFRAAFDALSAPPAPDAPA